MDTGKLLGKPNKLRGNDLRWTSIPSRGSRNTPSRFMLQKPEISSGSYGPLGSKGLILYFINEIINCTGGERKKRRAKFNFYVSGFDTEKRPKRTSSPIKINLQLLFTFNNCDIE